MVLACGVASTRVEPRTLGFSGQTRGGERDILPTGLAARPSRFKTRRLGAFRAVFGKSRVLGPMTCMMTWWDARGKDLMGKIHGTIIMAD